MAEQSSTTRTWGRSKIETSAMGLGCWAIGGEWSDPDGNPLGWGSVDDDESIRAVRRAVELGVTFFDTSDAYGTGHSERILGTALAGRRDGVVLATKWGNTFDESTRTLTGANSSPEYVRQALVASLARLGTDYVDVYQLHLSNASLEEGAALRDACEDLVTEGLIRGYAWSTDDPERAAVFAVGPHCAAVQHELSVLHDAPDLLAVCDEYDLASINRSPLAMGLLTGRFTGSARLSDSDIRAKAPDWLRWFENGAVSTQWQSRVDSVREVLTGDGRTLAQGALGWLWARSPRTVPIPGFRTVKQIDENTAALASGPLSAAQLAEIQTILAGDDR